MTSRTFLLAASFLFALTGCEGGAFASGSASSSREYCYQPCIVTLHGTTETTWTYGPPNFGNPKTDKRVIISVLVLDHKIDVRGSRVFDAAKGVAKVQLYLPTGMPSIKSNQRVTITGQLQGAVTATDIYPVVMQVSSVKKQVEDKERPRNQG